AVCRSETAEQPCASAYVAAHLFNAQRPIGRQELFPSPLCVAALSPGDVVRQVLDMNLHARAVRSYLLHGHAPFLYDQDRLVAVSGQRGLDDVLLIVVLTRRQQQPIWSVARFHAPGAFPSAGEEAFAELTSQAQVSLNLAVPAREAQGIGERRPQVADIGLEAVLH